MKRIDSLQFLVHWYSIGYLPPNVQKYTVVDQKRGIITERSSVAKRSKTKVNFTNGRRLSSLSPKILCPYLSPELHVRLQSWRRISRGCWRSTCGFLLKMLRLVIVALEDLRACSRNPPSHPLR